MRLPDNYFRELSPADIIAKVATITLANISLWGSDELERIGWLNNPVIDILYSMTNAGVWVARVDTAGKQLVAEANASSIMSFVANTVPGAVGAPTASYANASNRARRIKSLPVTLDASGEFTVQALHTGPAGYYPVVRLLGIWADFTIADMTFQISVSAGTLIGPASLQIATTSNQVTDVLGAHGLTMYDATDASVINIACDNTDPGGANGKIIILYEYWSET